MVAMPFSVFSQNGAAPLEVVFAIAENGVRIRPQIRLPRRPKMLTDAKVAALLDMAKHFVDQSIIKFPTIGGYLTRELESLDGRESFLVDVNRKGIKLSKCTYQNRYQVTEILLRLDIDGPTHDNPDGTPVPCPHLHIYREGFADKWASPIDPSEFTDTTNLVLTFQQFLARCKVDKTPSIQAAL